MILWGKAKQSFNGDIHSPFGYPPGREMPVPEARNPFPPYVLCTAAVGSWLSKWKNRPLTNASSSSLAGSGGNSHIILFLEPIAAILYCAPVTLT
jgi:hypothetical protein